MKRELPTEFRAMVSAQGWPWTDSLLHALADTDPEVSIRVNRAKGVAVPADADRVGWCAEGMYLAQRPQFTLDPAMHQGLYYVQDASSMIFAHIARHVAAELGDGPLRWLDACAAPGGKTTAVASALPAGSLVVANEADGARAAALAENVERWGDPSVIVTHGDARQAGRLTEMFDVVAVDAPCSGEGMMRKEAVAVSQWTPGLVRQCADLQRQIVEGVWPALRPGGILIYSTCTFNPSENTDNLAWMQSHLGAEPVDLGLGQFDGLVTEGAAARFIPGLTRGEGLFVAAVRKPGLGTLKTLRALKTIKTPVSWLIENDDYAFFTDREGILRAVRREHHAAVDAVTKVLRPVSAGLAVAQPKGRKLVPAHALALSTAFDAGQWPSAAVDYPTALAYLRGEALQLPADAPRGQLLLTYGDHPLGWVNNLGTRANNLLPQNRRIRLTQTPSSPVSLL